MGESKWVDMFFSLMARDSTVESIPHPQAQNSLGLLDGELLLLDPKG